MHETELTHEEGCKIGQANALKAKKQIRTSLQGFQSIHIKFLRGSFHQHSRNLAIVQRV